MNRGIKFTVIVKKWFDKVNGNTYHSVRCIRHRDDAIICGGFQYGYGDQYRYTALCIMAEKGWIPKKYREPAPHGGWKVLSYERENNYPILWKVSGGLKRECVANGKLE